VSDVIGLVGNLELHLRRLKRKLRRIKTIKSVEVVARKEGSLQIETETKRKVTDLVLGHHLEFLHRGRKTNRVADLKEKGMKVVAPSVGNKRKKRPHPLLRRKQLQLRRSEESRRKKKKQLL